MYYLKIILLVGLVFSVLGYILVVLKQKYYLKNNIIILDNKSITAEDFKDIDIKQMSYNGVNMKTGDEIKIVTREAKIYKGVLIGGKFQEGVLKIVTHSDKVKEISIKNISKLKLIREYGKFFTS